MIRVAQRSTQHRGLTANVALLVAALSLLVLADAATAVASAPASPARPSPAQLARTITGTGPIGTRIAAVRQALSAGGVATLGRSKPIVKAVPPASIYTASSLTSANMALEARATAGRITLRQLATRLRATGFPFKGRGSPSQQLRRYLSMSVKAAHRAPHKTKSFSPLFLEALARRQHPAISLTSPYRAGDLRLTALEIQLLVADIDRRFPFNDVVDPADALSAGATGAQVTDPCADLTRFLDKTVPLSGSLLREFGTRKFLPALVKDFARDVGHTDTKAVGHIFKGLSLTMKVVNLVQLYTRGIVSVSVEPQSIEKPLNPGVESAALFARLGVSDQDWNDYVELMQREGGADEYQGFVNCLSAAGLDLPKDLKSLAESLKDAKVRWRLHQAPSMLVEVSARRNNFDFPIAPLRPTGTYSGENVLLLDVPGESAKAKRSGKRRTGHVTATAEVLTAKPPNPVTFIKGALGGWGLAQGMTTLLTDWYRTAFPPTSTARLAVIYHECPPGRRCRDDAPSAPGFAYFALTARYEGTETRTSSDCNGPRETSESWWSSDGAGAATAQPGGWPFGMKNPVGNVHVTNHRLGTESDWPVSLLSGGEMHVTAEADGANVIVRDDTHGVDTATFLTDGQSRTLQMGGDTTSQSSEPSCPITTNVRWNGTWTLSGHRKISY